MSTNQAHPLSVELYLLGRIRPKVEQTCSHFPPPSRLRCNDRRVEVFQNYGHVLDLSPECMRT